MLTWSGSGDVLAALFSCSLLSIRIRDGRLSARMAAEESEDTNIWRGRERVREDELKDVERERLEREKESEREEEGERASGRWNEHGEKN